MPVNAELRRKNGQGDLVDYVLVDDPENTETALADPSIDYGTRARLTELVNQLDGHHTLGYVGDLMMVTAAAGQLYIGGAGRLTFAEAVNVRGLLVNPSNSGKLVYIVRIALFSSALAYAGFRSDPTVGLPTVNSTQSNALLGGAPLSAARVGFDFDLTAPLSGGLDLRNTVGMAAGVRTAFDLPPLILPPGHSFGFNVPYSSGSDFTCSIYWVERAPD